MLLCRSNHKRFGSVGGFWTGLRGSLVVVYCIPWAFLPRVMCGHRDGPWGLHNNYVTFPKFKHQAVIFVSDCLPFMTRNLNTLSITVYHMKKCCCISKKNLWDWRYRKKIRQGMTLLVVLLQINVGCLYSRLVLVWWRSACRASTARSG